MGKFKHFIFGATAIASIVLLAGCGGSKSSSSKKSSMTMAVTSTVDSLDPVLAYQTTSCTVVGNTDEGLYTVKNNGKAAFGLASKVTTSDNGLTKTYKIRKNAKWSDGSQVTANDFVFAWRRLSDPKVASAFNFELGAAGIKNADAIVAGKKSTSSLGVEAKDSKTLVVHLSKKVAYLPQLLSFSSFAPVQEKYYNQEGKKFAQTSKNLIASGPYKVSNWKQGDNTITLVKNNNYWDAKNVKTNKIKLQVITDPEKSAMAFKDGTVDYTTLSGQLVAKYKNDASFKNGLGNFTQYLMFNMKSTGLDNANLRKAIASSINKKAIVKNVLKDGSEVANSMIMKDLVTDPGTGKDFASESTTGYSYSPAKAKAYWNKAKKETSRRSITILYDDSDTAYANVAAYIQSQVQKNMKGMKVILKQTTKKTRTDKMTSGDFDVVLTRWGPDYADPTAILSMYQTDNTSNYQKWSSSKFDSLLNQAATTYASNPTKRYKALLKANNVLIDSAVCPPLYQSGSPVLQRSSVHGLTEHLAGVPFWFKYVSIK